MTGSSIRRETVDTFETGKVSILCEHIDPEEGIAQLLKVITEMLVFIDVSVS